MSIENLLLLDDVEFTVSGDNAYPDPGETISLVVTVSNYGNALSSVSGEITTNHSGITISDATTQFGAVATNEQSDNTADPFIIDISEKPFRQVGIYRDNMISPLLFPDIIHRFAKMYNDALVIIENNDQQIIIRQSSFRQNGFQI